MSEAQFAHYPSLRGKSVAISGGATGIGEAIVTAFARQGARVGFVDIQKEPGEALANKLNGEGGDVTFVHCDLVDIEAYRAALARIADKNGPILSLVNNAAHDERHDWRDVTPEYWDNRQAVNLRHAFFAIQAVAPGMIEAGEGTIVNFGSISWMILAGNMPGYMSAKAAMHGLTRGMARDLGPHNIRINSVVPGWVMTERQLTKWVGPEEEALIDAQQALAGRVMPENVASMVLFLSADDSRMISAQDFVVDGGWAHA